MNRVAIYRLLERGCNRLNPIRTAGAFFQYLIRGGILFGIIIFGLRILGVRQANLGTWEFLTFMGGITGLLLSLRHRLGLIEAAYWLDNHLHTREAFAAAVICLERNCSGMLDPLVIERAGKLAGSHPEIRWPFRNLIRPMAVALGVQFVFIPALIFAAPKLSFHLTTKSVSEKNYSSVIHRNVTQKTKPKIPGLPPQTIAEQLFPSDTHLAASLENALKTGNTEAIERLLGQAEKNSTAVAGDDIPIAKQKAFQAAKDYQRIAEGMERNFNGGLPSRQENGSRGDSSQKPGSGAENQETQMGQAVQNRQQGGRNGPKGPGGQQNGQNPYGVGANGYENPDDPGNPGNNSGASMRGGNKPGNGRGNNNAVLGTVLPDGTGRKVTVQPQGTMLEFVLPGKGAKLPLAQVVPAYKQASEAAMHRRGIPGEYQDYVRSYFQELSKETRINTGNSENTNLSKEEPK